MQINLNNWTGETLDVEFGPDKTFEMYGYSFKLSELDSDDDDVTYWELSGSDWSAPLTVIHARNDEELLRKAVQWIANHV